MRVLFLTNIPSPYRVDFFNQLGKECDLTVLFERDKASDRDAKWVSNNAKNYKEIFLKGRKLNSDGAISFDVIKWLNVKKFDIFVIGGYSTPTGMLAIQYLKFKKIPFVLNSDGGFIKKDKKMKYLIKKYFISSAKWWLSTGETTTEYLVHYGAKKEDTFVYPFTSIKEEDVITDDLCEKEKLKIRQNLGIKHDKVAISVGQLIHRKGYDLLINEWKNMDKDWILLIIGSGKDKEVLQKLILKNGIKNIRLIDFKQKEELKEYYLASDIFILPTREDIWGLVVNEAMSCGLPVITTDKCISGKVLIIPGVTGEIISLDEMNRLKDVIYNLYSNNDKSKRDAIKQKILCYTIEAMAYSHLEIFKKILNKEKTYESIYNNTNI